MKRFSMPSVAAVIAAIALPALPALAQTTPPASPPVMALMAPSAAVAATSSAPALPKAMAREVEQHIALLHAQLAITPAEEPQWKQFAQVMRDNAAQMEQAFSERGADLPNMNAVQDLQSYSQLAQIQSANMQKLADSFQTLYNIFPASQKQVADAVFRAKGNVKKPMLKSSVP